MTTPVEAVSWDITLGAAGTSFGRYILSSTSSTEDEAPDSIDHTGVKVFGNLYEFGDCGILTSPVVEGEELKSKYPAFSLRSVEEVGCTSKTQEEFEAWVEEQNNGDFQGSNYDVVTRSCVVWARLAAQFLEVSHPTNWDKIIIWAEKNKSFTSQVGMLGMGSRQFQHAATDYVTDPKKLKNKFKKFYKKLRRKRQINPENENPPAGEEVVVDGEDDDSDDDEDDDGVFDELNDEEIHQLKNLYLQEM